MMHDLCGSYDLGIGMSLKVHEVGIDSASISLNYVGERAPLWSIGPREGLDVAEVLVGIRQAGMVLLQLADHFENNQKKGSQNDER